MLPLFRNRITGELFNEKYSFPVGRDCSELFCGTSICRSWPVWLFQTEVILLRTMLSTARTMLRAGTCVLYATAMLRTGTML